MKEDKTEGRVLLSPYGADKRSTLRRSLVSLACLLAPLGLAACSGIGGTTYGTGVTQEQALLDDISSMAGGLGSKDKTSIDYKPRAGLVLPPDTSRLPAPDQKNQLVASNNDWPTDPDELRKLYQERMASMSDKEREELIAAIRRLPPKQRDAIFKNNSNRAAFARQIKEPELRASAQAKAEYEKQVQERLALIRLQQGKNAEGRKYLTQPPERFTNVTPEVQQEISKIDPKDKKEESFFQKIWPF